MSEHKDLTDRDLEKVAGGGDGAVHVNVNHPGHPSVDERDDSSASGDGLGGNIDLNPGDNGPQADGR